MKKLSKLLLSASLVLLSVASSAQVDTRFWFVAPEVTKDHMDAPVVFRVTAFEQKADVTISMPANPEFTPIEFTVDPNSQYSVSSEDENTFKKNLIENRPASEVLKKGILIESDTEISAYYEVAATNNPDKFILKGDNALGTDFYIPSQNAFENQTKNNDVLYEDPARERIDIVASENNTEVTIMVTDDVVDKDDNVIHGAGDTFTVNLEQGETFSVTAKNTDKLSHLGGSRVTSNKPVAVTISDDSVREPGGGHWDLIGDQLIPVPLLGTEYIAMHSLYGQTNDQGKKIVTDQKVYILAVKDNTTIWVDGAENATINAGEMREIDIVDNAAFIKADNPVYAYQVTGIPPIDKPNAARGTELGSAILPNITCTGSTSISFTRVLTDRFYVQLMTKGKYRDDFDIQGPNGGNGENPADYLDNPDWIQVPGTGDNGEAEAWYTAVIQMGWQDGDGLTTGTPYTISNENLFHLGILDENSVSMSFGYFSDYSSLRITGTAMNCEGDIITLSTQDPMRSYKWFSEENPFDDIGTKRSIQVQKSGKYWVDGEVQAGGCYLTDTIDVIFKVPEFELGNDTVVCPGEPVSFDIEAINPGDAFLWTPGDVTSSTYEVIPDPEEEIEVSLTITDDLGCSSTETLNVTGHPAPSIDWNIPGDDICMGDTLRTSTKMKRYEWSIDGTPVPGHDLPYLVPTSDGVYSLTVWNNEACSESQSIDLTVHPAPVPNISDVWECPGDNGTITAAAGYAYLWEYGNGNTATGNSLTLSSPDSVHVTTTDNSTGCSVRDTVVFDWYNKNVFTFGNDTSVCINEDITIEIDDTFSGYLWTFERESDGNVTTFTPTPGHVLERNAVQVANDQGTYSITATDINGCTVTGSFDLEVQTTPELDIEQFIDICKGDTIKIATQDHRFERFAWTMDSDPTDTLTKERFVLVTDPGTYRLRAWQDNNCWNTATSTVNTWESPDFDLTDVEVCPNEGFSIQLENWSSPRAGTDADPRDHKWSKWSWTESERDSISDEPILANPDSGLYYLTVYDEDCFRTKKVKVDFHDLTVFSLEDKVACDNENFTLEIPPGLVPQVTSYEWEREATGDTGPPGSDWPVPDDGDYILKITDNNGCPGADTLTLEHLPSPVFNLGAGREKCYGDTVMIQANPDFKRYEWNGITDNGQTHHIPATNTGTHSLRVWLENGCSSVNSVDITVHDLPRVDLGPDREGCSGDFQTLTIDNFPRIYWSNGSREVTTVEVGNGPQWVKVRDANGCVGGDTTRVTWHPIPRVDLGPDRIICPVNYPITIEAPGGFDEYKWHTGERTRVIKANLLDTVNLVRVKDDKGCSGFDTKVVKTIKPFVFSLGDDMEACAPEKVVLDAGTELVREYAGVEEVMFFDEYTWSTGSGGQQITIDSSGVYWAEVTDGCFRLRDTVHVDYYPSPEIATLDTTIYARVSVIAESGTEPYYYSLNGGEFQDNRTFRDVANGEHTIEVEDVNGCRAVTLFTLDSHYDLDIPNFFTPNNDGINDVWEVDGLDRLPESTISIFDRYGKLLVRYKADEEPWNGEYNNRPVPSDDYWYVIHLQPVDKIIRGNITIKR